MEAERQEHVPGRYARQEILPEIGTSGQKKLAQSSVLIAGCGAVGGIQAELLTRAGVGKIRLADRDFVEVVNLHRQVLFDENDAANRIAKAEAGAKRLRSINSTVEIEPHVLDINAQTIEGLIAGVDLVIDGTDNYETRYVINDACIKHRIPWIYCGVIGTTGMVMLIEPAGPCFRCLAAEVPAPGTVPKCNTAGVLNTAVAMTASLPATIAMKFLTGAPLHRKGLFHFDPWNMSFEYFEMERRKDCPCCVLRKFEFLEQK